jgi:VWFA-related protein
MRNRRAVPAVFLGLVVGGLVPAGLQAVDPAGSTVTMDVTVQAKGAGVPGLGVRNFRVFEDGEARDVVRAEPAGPASIVLLVENSLHSWRYLHDVRSAIRGFLRAAPEGRGHTYALVTFGRQTKVEQSLTPEIERIRAAFGDVRQSAWDRTDTVDAVYRVAEEMEALPGRRVLIFVGFGYDAFSKRTFAELQRKLAASRAQVWAIATGSDQRRDASVGPVSETAQPPDLQQGEMLIRMMAQQTGGKYFCPLCDADYVASMRETLATLDEKQYTVEYRRPAGLKPGFHKLRVEAFQLIGDRRENFTVRAREGWRVEAAKQK